jgi:starch phosphorylase
MHVFEVEVYLGGLNPNSVRVDLYANGVNEGEPEQREMIPDRQLAETNVFIYCTQVTATRPASDYTARVIPLHAGVAIPLEASRILWQR